MYLSYEHKDEGMQTKWCFSQEEASCVRVCLLTLCFLFSVCFLGVQFIPDYCLKEAVDTTLLK